eukprot:1583371-Ditylum_brightwellii.AAC.1
MEFKNQNNKRYDVSVTGFGCPALVSKELSVEMQDFVTTVIVDSDVIPRMSAATIANVVLDVMEYDWVDMGRRDVQQALEEISSSSGVITKVMSMVDDILERDGRGISGSRAPCDFFGEIDVTRTMLDDHTIDSGYRRIFLDLMREVMEDPHFRFEEHSKDQKR